MRTIKIAVATLPALAGCTTAPRPVEARAAEGVVLEFFEALDVDGFDPDRVADLLTPDFRIYEMGEEYDWPGFLEFFGGYRDGRTISTEWTLSDFRTDTDVDSAHVFYRNHGVFKSRRDDGGIRVTTLDWLESAHLVRRDGRLLLRFLQSDDVEVSVEEIPPGDG